MTEINKKQKKNINLNPFVLLFLVIAVCGIASFFVTPGTFEREVIDGRTVVVPNSFHVLEKNPISVFDIFRAVPQGLIGSSSIIFLILIVGGAIEVFNKSGSLSMGVSKMISKMGGKGDTLILIVLMIIFAILGGFLGWVEAAIPFAPIVVPIILELGFDSLTAVAVPILGLMIGFAVGPTNVYTIGVAHAIAELPLFSGFGLRFTAYLVFVTVAILHTVKYAVRVKKDPTKSYVADIDVSDLKIDFSKIEGKEMSGAQKLSLVILASTFAVVVYGMLKLSWTINDMSAAFLVAGIVVGFICKMNAGDIADTFIAGAKGSMGGALIVGIASGVQWILETGGIIDPAINGLANLLSGFPPIVSAIGIMIIVSLLNGLVPSRVGKAMALMPLLIPLGDIVGLTRQITTLAYQFGDAITNIFWFTFGSLLIFLSYGRVPLQRYYKFVIPLMVVLFIIAIIFLTIATSIGYGPF
ncbi:MAG: TRAP transporter large permease subunit [Tissierellaceae bacterium]|nr:TRAP transporter large permease subunit [Tissierellaceae bacterium]